MGMELRYIKHFLNVLFGKRALCPLWPAPSWRSLLYPDTKSKRSSLDHLFILGLQSADAPLLFEAFFLQKVP